MLIANYMSRIANCVFPLAFVPTLSYKTGGRRFGAKRPSMGNQLHGACDLIAPKGTEVFALDDGVVIRGPKDFYHNTFSLEVRHTFFIARYCEILGDTPVKVGDHVKKGQVIAYVGQMYKDAMLHLELFSGTATGPLSNKGNPPYMRRSDLIDPTPLLDLWSTNLPTKVE